MADSGIGDATFPNKLSEAQRIKIENEIGRRNSYLMGDKYDIARCRFIAEDPIHGPVLRANDKAERWTRFGYNNGGCAGMIATYKIANAKKAMCFEAPICLAFTAFAVVVGGKVGSMYGRRKYQVDTLDRVTAEAKFQEWFVKNESLILTDRDKFVKWLDKNRLSPQAKFQELYKKARGNLFK